MRWWWPMGLVLVVSALLAAVQLQHDPLDDPDPAHQRPGLPDLDPLPVPAPNLEGRPGTDGPTLLVFERAGRPAPCAWLDAPELRAAEIVLAIGASEGAAAADVCPGATHASEPWRLARQVGMRTPRDGGFPVGYAIVDDDGLLRYRTLDPDMSHLLGEVGTMVHAVARR